MEPMPHDHDHDHDHPATRTSQPTFSAATLKALVDVITGGAGMGLGPMTPIGIYRSAPKIERLMHECGLAFQLQGGSRLPTLAAYLRDLAADGANTPKLERVLLRVAEPDDYAGQPERQRAVIDHLNRVLARDRRQIVLHEGQPRLVERGKPGSAAVRVLAEAVVLDIDTVQRDIGRALASAASDPEGAVTAACSVVEAVCRSVLIELGLPLPAYDQVCKASHSFNLLDARRAISVTERQRYILRVRKLSQAVAEAYFAQREKLGFPGLKRDPKREPA